MSASTDLPWLPRALFPAAGLLQATPWLWYSAHATDRGLAEWAAPGFAFVAAVLVATSLWPYWQQRGSAAACFVTVCGASFAVVSLTSLFLGNALLELLTALSLGLAASGAAWRRWGSA